MSSVFKEPQCLMFTDLSTGKLRLDQHVLDQIATVTKSINSVAITGLYRTGKSYLLTRLAGKSKGFPLGSTIQSKTKGIWAWCVKHPVRKGEMLLLLDTEGIGDIKKGDKNHDNQLFTLATLLSSTLIYNTFGIFDDDSLNKLTFITEMSKNIKTYDANQSASDIASNDADFDIYFPEFILTLRDFTLDLEIDDHEISSDEYLEHCLEAKEGDTPEIHSFNEPRLCIRKYFNRRKCFVFGFPTTRRKMKELDNLSDSDLNADFVEDTHAFISYVINNSQPMKMTNGTHVTGRMFSNLAINYVEAIRQGAIPCIQSALKSMALIENKEAVEEAFGIYVCMMENDVVLPTEDAESLRDVHLNSKDMAFKHFLKHRVLDDDNTYKVKLDNLVVEEYNTWTKKNKDQSEELCKGVLKKLHAKISTNINDGVYAVPGGYELYVRDREELKRKYDKTSGLGLLKEEGFEFYTQYMQNEADAVLKSDQTISEKEKALCLERESKERAEMREAVVQKKLKQSDKERKAMGKQYADEVKKLREVHLQEMAEEKARMDQITEKRMRETERLITENLQKMRDLQEIQMKEFKKAQEKRDKEMKRNAVRLNNEVVYLREDNKEMEDELKRLKDELEREKTLRLEREEKEKKEQEKKEKEKNEQTGCSIS